MLTEKFVASIGVPSKAPGTNVARDAAIFLHEFQPLSQQRAVFKKSASPPNCLAVSETHIFAPQAEKGVVHVYHREKGNQEATVPFTERISSITLACDDTVLVLGTIEGRIFLWETCTGRQVTTNQAHLQSVTALAVDSNSNFLLSASRDSTIHVWSIPALLSFANSNIVSPIRTFSSHGSAISGLVLGHSASHCNFAVSLSKDRSCMIWDYRTGNVLRTYLLPGVPLCAALDPADRAVYLGYEDGTLQFLDLYTAPDGKLDAVQNGRDAAHVVQPASSSKWKLPDPSHGPALSLDVSYDGSTVISGHQYGAILSWDVARGSFASSLTPLPLPGPVNNIHLLPVTGHQRSGAKTRHIRINEIVKPKFGAFDTSDSGNAPGNYTMNVELQTDLNAGNHSTFMKALTAPIFPTDLLDEGLSELATWGRTAPQANGSLDATEEDFMALDAPSAGKSTLPEENASLKAQLESLRRVQKKSFEKMEKLGEENKALAMREKKRLAKKASKNSNGIADDESSD